MNPVTFKHSAEFRRWLERNHATAAELLVAFQRKTPGFDGLTYAQALDEALCYGWIDGVRKRRDADSYTIRFTPRRPRSIWSRINVRHVERLQREGRIQPAGLAAFASRAPDRTGVYSFENDRPDRLPPELERVFRANPAAYAFHAAQPPGYRRTLHWWIISAKREETRRRRLAHVIARAEAGRRIDFMSPLR